MRPLVLGAGAFLVLASIGIGAQWHRLMERSLVASGAAPVAVADSDSAQADRDTHSGHDSGSATHDPEMPSGHAEHRDDAQQAGQLWTCGMHPQVLQDHPGTCPICRMQLVPVRGRSEPHSGQGGQRGGPTDRKVKYYWDPMMSPPYISKEPGRSPMGMELVPVYEDEVSGGAEVRIDPAVVQNMGVRLAAVVEAPLLRTVRAVGYVEEAQSKVEEINLRVSGWIERLYADVEGQHVERGQPLLDLYSPELEVAVQELISARNAAARMPAVFHDLEGRSSTLLYDSAVRKLELLGLERGQIDELSRLDRTPATVTFTSPVSGHVMKKPIVQGSAVKAGDLVLRIVDHSVVWVDTQVYEQDLPLVRIGAAARATTEALPGETFSGQISFIHPHIDPVSRTALVRLTVPNQPLRLRPGMFARVEIEGEPVEHAILVPREAVIDTGVRQVVFVARAVGHFEPRNVKLGQRGDDGLVQVLEGLAPGDTVVVSGQFLLDAESRLREAIEKFLNTKKTP